MSRIQQQQEELPWSREDSEISPGELRVLAALAAQALVAVVESRTGPVEKLSQGTSHLLS